MIYVQFVKNTFVSIVIVFCISGITLLGAQLVLEEYFSEVNNSLAFSGDMYSGQNKKISEVNDIIKKTEVIQDIHNLWSQKILELGNATPKNVSLNSMALNKQKNEISLSGIAKDRDSLLELKTNIEKLDFIEKIEIPLSQLTEKENIDFSIVIKMK